MLNEYMEKGRKQVLKRMNPDLIGHSYYDQTYYHPQVHHPDIQGKWVRAVLHTWEMHLADGTISAWLTTWGNLIHVYINGHKLDWSTSNTPGGWVEAKRFAEIQLKVRALAILKDLGFSVSLLNLDEFRVKVE